MLRSNRRLIPPLVLALVATGAAAAVADEAVLPAKIGAWERVDLKRVPAPELEQVAGDQAALLREYGSLRAEQAVYRRGVAEWRVRVYVMIDRSAAYGAFTVLRPDRWRAAHIGEAGVAGVDALLFYQSNCLVNTQELASGFDSPLRELIEHLKQLEGPQASLPTLPSYLPREGFIAGSDSYLLGPLALARVAPLAEGDWAGFAYGAEVEAARYRLDSRQATLLLISYPTPQIAIQRLRDFERLFNLNGTGDPVRPLAYAKRSSTLVVVVAGVESGQLAARLLSRVRYQAQFSWADPSDTRPKPNWPKTLANIFVGIGLLVIFAMLSGVLFGIVRLVVKRLMPGRVFDRPEDSEIIRLDLDLRR